jgi:hypothetical protein
MQQQLVVPAAHAPLAEALLRRIRRQAARTGKWTCPACQTRTISANTAMCRACSSSTELTDKP